MHLRTGTRIRARLALDGPLIRSALLARAPPPFVDSPSLVVQLLAHVYAALGSSTDPFALYQLAFQRPLLTTSSVRTLVKE